MPTPRRPGDPHPRGREVAFGPTARVRRRWPAACLTLLLALAARTATAAPTTPNPTTPAANGPATPSPAATASPATATTSPATATTSPATATPSPATATTSPATATGVSTSAPATAGSASAGEGTAASPSAAPSGETPGPAPTTTATATAPAAPTARVPARKPPRVDGPYIGGTLAAGGTFARVNNFPTPDPLSGGTMSLRFGEAIYPWMTIGLQVTGTWANRFADPRQRLLQGAAIVDFGFLPVPRIPLSLHVGFGAGGGAVRQADRTARSGFGGAVFTGAVRYEIFPLAARKRPTRGGGFSLGPELGWIGFTPAAKGRPMSNTVYLGLFMGFYFGS